MIMQFSTSYSAPSYYNKTLKGFKGVDFTSAKLDVAENRAISMQNFIYKDGINQKRNGYNQVFEFTDIKEKVNGFWEFKDSDKITHRIAHVGNKIYKVNYGDTIFGNTFTELKINYIPSIYNQDESDVNEWNKYISQINNDRSFGVVRGDRLYILCGIYLVYGDWGKGYELRAVRDNEDTYIPTTSTNITHLNYEGSSSRASLEDANMMSLFRKNKLYGDELYTSKIPFQTIKGDPTTLEIGSDEILEKFSSKKTTIFTINNEQIEGLINVKFYVGDANDSSNLNNRTYLNIPIKKGMIEEYRYWDVETNKTVENFYTINPNSTFKTLCDYFYVYYKYDGHMITMIVCFDRKDNEEYNLYIKQVEPSSALVYQLDSKNISKKYNPVVKITLPSENLTFDYWDDNGFATDTEGINNVQIDFDEGKLYLYKSFHNELDPNPNIEVTFTTDSAISKKEYQKIDKCSVGIMFGYNGVEHLFVSGNDNYGNMDWHTTEAFADNTNSKISNKHNLTYFGDLNYAYLGNPQTKVKSYILLNDSTLGILKEYSSTETSLFIREPYITDAIDASGMIVTDINGNPYQKIYYKQYMSAIGEGCISSYATSNLSGDKLFLSENGVYGIQLESGNYASNNRYAVEKSRLINPKLEKAGKNILKNATAISFENRYYLSLNDAEGTVYIADARFRNRENSEMNDTMGYEWWVWKGVKAYTWFIDMNGNLGFTDEKGGIYLFNDSELYLDKNIQIINSGGISYDNTSKRFIINEKYDVKKGYTIKFNNAIEEMLYNVGSLKKTLGRTYLYIMKDGKKDIEAATKFIPFLENKSLIIRDKDGNIFDENAIIYNQENEEEKWLNEGLFKIKLSNGNFFSENVDNYSISVKVYKSKILNYYSDTSSFELLSLNGSDVMNVYQPDQLSSIKSLLSNDKIFWAFWQTPYMNMGTSDFAKTLRYFTVIPENILHGSAEIFFLTKDKKKEVVMEGIDEFSMLEALDFSSFSLELKDYVKSFSKKLKIRNFNFLSLFISSANDKNFAVQNFNLSYVISKRNRGVK